MAAIARRRRYTAEEMAELMDSDEEHSIHDIDYEELPQNILHNLSNSEDNTSDSDNDTNSDNETYTAPSGRHWSRPTANSHRGRFARPNVMHHRPGFLSGLHPECEKEAFDVFTTDLLEILVRYTNLEARRRILQITWLQTVWNDVDRIEMEAFIGIHILCGVYKAQYRDIKELFRE